MGLAKHILCHKKADLHDLIEVMTGGTPTEVTFHSEASFRDDPHPWLLAAIVHNDIEAAELLLTTKEGQLAAQKVDWVECKDIAFCMTPAVLAVLSQNASMAARFLELGILRITACRLPKETAKPCSSHGKEAVGLIASKLWLSCPITAVLTAALVEALKHDLQKAATRVLEDAFLRLHPWEPATTGLAPFYPQIRAIHQKMVGAHDDMLKWMQTLAQQYVQEKVRQQSPLTL